MLKKLHIFLGATVADAAARPLHWVYDEKKLKSYIKGKKILLSLNKIDLHSTPLKQVKFQDIMMWVK